MIAARRSLGPLATRILHSDGRNSVCKVFKKHSSSHKADCWMPVCGVSVRKVPIEDSREKCRISTFLMQNLFKDDPLMVAAGMNKNDPDPGLIQYLSAVINENHSVYASIDMTREIIGVCLARHTKEITVKELFKLSNRLSYPETGKYMQVIASIEEKANIYRSYSSPRAWSIECLCTGRAFRRRGIAKLLLKMSKSLAEDDPECNIIKFTCSNAYAARAAVACGGMKIHSSRAPTDCKDEKGNAIISRGMCPPHKNVELFVGDSKKKSS